MHTRIVLMALIGMAMIGMSTGEGLSLFGELSEDDGKINMRSLSIFPEKTVSYYKITIKLHVFYLASISFCRR
jgi:hypothetical protein